MPIFSETMLFCTQSAKRQHRGCKFSSYTCKIWIMAVICAILMVSALVLLYFLLTKIFPVDKSVTAFSRSEQWEPQCTTSQSATDFMFDCYPENVNVHPDTCYSRGCCSTINRDLNLSGSGCYYPRNFGYRIRNKVKVFHNRFEIPLIRIPTPSRYGDDMNVVNVMVEKQTPYRLRIKFYDAMSERFEVPTLKIPSSEGKIYSKNSYLYSVTYDSTPPFNLKVIRPNSNTTIFDTSVSALTLSHQFLEVSSSLPSFNIYGFGGQFHSLNNESQTLRFFTDLKTKTMNIQPAFLCLENDGNAYGIMLLNSNAMEIKLMASPSAITFRTIGGILDFYIFLGSTPDDVVKQYIEAVGRPVLPPYWSLGFYLSVDDDGDDLTTIKQTLESFASNNLPLDTLIWNSQSLENYLENRGKQFLLSDVDKLCRKQNQKLILTMKPEIRIQNGSSWNSIYMSGLKKKSYILNNWGVQPSRGKINDVEVVYPDFGNRITDLWWKDILQKLYRDVKFDGLWLINNIPINELDGNVIGCLKDNLNRPPYLPGDKQNPIYSRTLCMDSIHHWKDKTFRHYDVHNLYGHNMVSSTEQNFRNLNLKRKLLISDSSFVGTGHLSGHVFHADGTWKNLKSSIPLMLNLNLNGIPLVGSNLVCEHQRNSVNEELCLRWIQLGAFYPLSIINNFKVNSFSKYSIEFFHSIRTAIQLKYELLPFLYTLFYFAHINGSAVLRPLFSEFPEDLQTYSIQTQFMWGSSLLISPILQQASSYLQIYLPRGVWFDFYSGKKIISTSSWLNQSIEFDTAIPLHIKCGHIIVLQVPSLTTKDSRSNSMKLIVALNETFEAEGFLYWDDGDSQDSVISREYVYAEFIIKKDTLFINGNAKSKKFQTNIYIQHVQILGLTYPPKIITINESYQVSQKQKQWNTQFQVLDIYSILIPLEGTTQIRWHSML